MVSVADAIQYLFPGSSVITDWSVRQDPTGPAYIAYWNPALGTQPTPQQLAAVTDQQVADAAKAKRDAAAPDLAALRDAATQAVTDCDTYIAIASPTNAQALAQTRKLTQQMRAVVKALQKLVAAQV